MDRLNCFRKVDFTCDKCGGEFYQTTAYSVAQDWEEFEEEYTYVVDVSRKKKQNTQR